MSDNLKELLEAATREDKIEFTNEPFDVFLRVYGYSLDDTSTRVLIPDLYFAYAQFFYKKFKKLPNRNRFASKSQVYAQMRMRTTSPDSTNKNKFEWGMWCSEQFKKAIEKVKDDKAWQEKYRRIKSSKRKKQSIKKSKQENELLDQLQKQLGIEQSIQPSKNDSTQE